MPTCLTCDKKLTKYDEVLVVHGKTFCSKKCKDDYFKKQKHKCKLCK